MRLENKIGLAGKPVTAARKVRKDRFGRLDAFVGRFVRVVWRGGLIRSHGGGRGFNGRRVGLLGTRSGSARCREYDARKRDNEDRRPRARSIGEVRHPSEAPLESWEFEGSVLSACYSRSRRRSAGPAGRAIGRARCRFSLYTKRRKVNPTTPGLRYYTPIG